MRMTWRSTPWKLAIMLLSTAAASLPARDEIQTVLYHRTTAGMKSSAKGAIIYHTPSRLSCAVKVTSRGARGHAYVVPAKSCHVVTSTTPESNTDSPVYLAATEIKDDRTQGKDEDSESEPIIEKIIPPTEDTDLVLVTTGGYLYYVSTKTHEVLFQTRFNAKHAIKAYYDGDAEKALIVCTPSQRISISVEDGKVIKKPHQYNYVVDLGSAGNVTAILRNKQLELLEGDKRTTVTIKQARPEMMYISQHRKSVFWSSIQNDQITITETLFSGKEGSVYHPTDIIINSFLFKDGGSSVYTCGLDGVVHVSPETQFRLPAVHGECMDIQKSGYKMNILLVKEDQMFLVKYKPFSRMMPRETPIPLDTIPDDAGKWTLQVSCVLTTWRLNYHKLKKFFLKDLERRCCYVCKQQQEHIVNAYA